MKKRILSMLIAFAMLTTSLGSLATTTFAEESSCSHQNYTNGFCDGCGAYESAVQDEDGYYEISNGGQLFWFANYVNTVDRTANAILTDDIDLENRPWTPIGSTGETSNNFRGHFDGQNHTIKGLNVEGGRSGLGFFGEVRLGTVENFTIYGEVTLIGKYDYVGGVIGSAPGANSNKPDHNGATIRNIISYVNVTLGEGSHGSNRVGGFMGYANHETIIENCVWYGTLDLGEYRAQDGVGGLVGKANDNSAVTIRNCAAYGTIKTSYKSGSYNDFDSIFIGGILSNSVTSAASVIENTIWAGEVVNETDLGSDAIISAFGSLSGVGSVTNCYYLDGSVPYVTTNNTNTEGILAFDYGQLTSGEIAYKLGEAFGQTIGVDDRPVPGGKRVYQVLNCEDETIKYSNNEGEVIHDWSNHDGKCAVCGDECTEHSYENGFCSICGGYEPAKLVDDYYEISNAGQLYWFASQVNGGNTGINGKLTENIVDNEDVLDSDGALNGDESDFREWIMIGDPENAYEGTFDGDNHTVSGICLVYIYSSGGVGLFGHITATGKIQNVGVIDSYFSCINFNFVMVGGVVGHNEGGTVTNCYNSGNIKAGKYSGGVVGRNTGTVIGCYNSGGIIKYGGGTSSYIGGVVGHNSGTVTDCYYDITVYGGNAIGNKGSSNVTNVEGKTTEQFKSGEVAYLLSESFGQELGSDDYPTLGGKKVYYGYVCDEEIDDMVYTNISNVSSESKPEHVYIGGYCECGARDPESMILGDVDGDGSVTNADVLMIYRYIYSADLYPLDVTLGDVDRDGLVTNADVLAIYRNIYSPELYPLG